MANSVLLPVFPVGLPPVRIRRCKAGTVCITTSAVALLPRMQHDRAGACRIRRAGIKGERIGDVERGSLLRGPSLGVGIARSLSPCRAMVLRVPRAGRDGQVIRSLRKVADAEVALVICLRLADGRGFPLPIFNPFFEEAHHRVLNGIVVLVDHLPLDGAVGLQAKDQVLRIEIGPHGNRGGIAVVVIEGLQPEAVRRGHQRVFAPRQAREGKAPVSAGRDRLGNISVLVGSGTDGNRSCRNGLSRDRVHHHARDAVSLRRRRRRGRNRLLSCARTLQWQRALRMPSGQAPRLFSIPDVDQIEHDMRFLLR